MPAVVPIVGAVAAVFASISLGGGLVGALVGVAVAFGVSYVGGRLFPQKAPTAPSFAFEASGILIQTNSATEPHKIIYGQIRCSGNISLKATTNSGTTYGGGTRTGTNVFFHQMICFAGHEIEEFSKVYFGDTELTLDGSGWVTSAPYFKDGASYARVIKHLGGAGQVADTDAVAQIDGWDSSCIGNGIAYLYVIMEFNTDIFTAGVPNVTALVKGKKVYDPRSATTAWSSNPVLCIRDYLTSEYGFSVPSDGIDDVLAIANANICDEDVDLKEGGTQNRYECHGFLSLDNSPMDNLQKLSSSVAAPITYVQGKFRINVAVYDSPGTNEITDDMIIGEVTMNPRMTRKELFNAVQGTFADPDKNYQPTSFPIVTNATYETQDGGQRIIRDLQLPFEKSAERAQRLAKILLEKARQGIFIEMVLHPSAGMNLAVWDTFTYTNTVFGWTDKVFRLMNWSFDPVKGVAITAQEESSASYDWNEGEATIIDAAPDTNLPDPFTVAIPGAPMVAESLYSTIGSAGVKTKALVSWTASADAFVREYQLEYKLAADTDYIVIPRTPDTSYTIFDIQPGSYNFRVKAINTIGITSSYNTVTIQIFGLTALPQNVENFSLNAINNNAHLTWNSADQSVDLDVLVGGAVRIRFSPDTISATWSNSIDIAPELNGLATSATVPLLTGTYFAKFVDSSGNESAVAASIVSNVADIVKMNVVATLTEDPGFTGTKTDMSVSGGILSLSADGSVFETHGIYQSSTYLDLGKVTTSRFSFSAAVTVSNSVDLFDSRAGDFDDASGYFDGGDVSGVAVKGFISTTDDDPSGSPTWSAYRQFFIGDYTCRAARFKLDVLSEDSSYQIDISALSWQADCPDVVDSGTLSTASGALTTVNFNKAYVVTSPFVGATILDAATGDYLVISNVDSDSFDIGVKNIAGTFIVRSVNWHAKGY